MFSGDIEARDKDDSMNENKVKVVQKKVRKWLDGLVCKEVFKDSKLTGRFNEKNEYKQNFDDNKKKSNLVIHPTLHADKLSHHRCGRLFSGCRIRKTDQT